MSEPSPGLDQWLAERETADRDLEAARTGVAWPDALAERPELWRDLEEHTVDRAPLRAAGPRSTTWRRG